MMANKGRIYAFDIAEKRLANLKPRMTRAGVTTVHPQRIDNEHDAHIARLAGEADRVLVDAPPPARGSAPCAQPRFEIPPIARNPSQAATATSEHFGRSGQAS